MNHPNRIPIIVGGVIGITALALLLLLPKDGKKEPEVQATDPTGGIQIYDPTGPKPTEPNNPENPTEPAGPTEPTDIPSIDIPKDDDTVKPTDPMDLPDPKPKDPVVDSTDDKVIKPDKPKEDPKVPAGTVTEIGKPNDETPDTDQGEIRNDVILQEKEENKPPKEEIKDAIVVGGDKVSVGSAKDEVVVVEPGTVDTGEGNKYAPEFKLPTGGDNPFDDGTKTDIEDTPVEDLIGKGEDRPGEGIHF